MGYRTDGLTFNTLRQANLQRIPTFRNAKGEETDHSKWGLCQWLTAVCGELGEAANLIKKIERGDFTLDEARAELAKELADTQTYLDLLAHAAGINLGRATIEKFNEVSKRIGSPVYIGYDGDWHLWAPAPKEESDG